MYRNSTQYHTIGSFWEKAFLSYFYKIWIFDISKILIDVYLKFCGTIDAENVDFGGTWKVEICFFSKNPKVSIFVRENHCSSDRTRLRRSRIQSYYNVFSIGKLNPVKIRVVKKLFLKIFFQQKTSIRTGDLASPWKAGQMRMAIRFS